MRTNRAIKNKLRNFRITTDLDNRLVEAAEAVEADVSRLLRDLVSQGTDTILTDHSVRESLRRRYAI